MFAKKIDSPIGKLLLVEEDNKLKAIFFEGEIEHFMKENEVIVKDTKLLIEAKRQLDLYFDKKLKQFNIPLLIEGTDFQKKVWNELLKIPYGLLVTYKDIAGAMINKKSYRAVGNANNKNKIPIIIPCHRVIGVNKKLVGYAGGLDIKEKLIKIEQS